MNTLYTLRISFSFHFKLLAFFSSTIQLKIVTKYLYSLSFSNSANQILHYSLYCITSSQWALVLFQSYFYASLSSYIQMNSSIQQLCSTLCIQQENHSIQQKLNALQVDLNSLQVQFSTILNTDSSSINRIQQYKRLLSLMSSLLNYNQSFEEFLTML